MVSNQDFIAGRTSAHDQAAYAAEQQQQHQHQPQSAATTSVPTQKMTPGTSMNVRGTLEVRGTLTMDENQQVHLQIGTTPQAVYAAEQAQQQQHQQAQAASARPPMFTPSALRPVDTNSLVNLFGANVEISPAPTRTTGKRSQTASAASTQEREWETLDTLFVINEDMENDTARPVFVETLAQEIDTHTTRTSSSSNNTS
eukprot:3525621-Amphidinium_carterae.2